MDQNIDYILLGSCPNCGGDINSIRLTSGSCCIKCIPDDIKFENPMDMVLNLQRNGNLSDLKWLKDNLEEYSTLERMFRDLLGTPPLELQRSWIIRALRGESFAIISPPGTGKSTFGVIMSIYFSMKMKKTLAILPTRVLLEQMAERIRNFSSKMGLNVRVLLYHSGIRKKDEILEKIENNDFDVLLITGRFAVKNYSTISKNRFSFFFIDDVDMALKSSKSMEAILRIVGFRDEDFSILKNRSYNEGEDVFDRIHKIRNERLNGKVAVFSSATASRALPSFTALMGFRPGTPLVFLRNVYDSYSLEFSDDFLIKAIKALGPGTLLFLPPDISSERGEEIERFLNVNGIRASLVKSGKERSLSLFSEGKIDVLIGSAFQYGVLVRGIDMPERIKNAVFYGVPRFTFRVGERIPITLVPRMLSALSIIRGEKELSSLAVRIRRRIKKLSVSAIKKIQSGEMEGDFEMAYRILGEAMMDEKTLNEISRLAGFVIDNGRIMLPDPMTYIQGSGRTSRMYSGKLTTGISLVIVDNSSLFENFRKRVDLFLEDTRWLEFKPDDGMIGEMQIMDILKRMDDERKRISKEGIPGIGTKLMIVESPTKAKTISGFFSKPAYRDLGGLMVYETFTGNSLLITVATQGHLMELTTRPLGLHGVGIEWRDGKVRFLPYYGTIKRCKNGHQFVDPRDGLCPRCGSEIEIDKMNVIKSLQRLALESEQVLICTDPDTEGEKIAMDVYSLLRPFNRNIRRGEFHEITKRAVMEAIHSPRDIDLNLVKAQVVRRVEDRWLGFTLSSIIQKDFWRIYCRRKNLDCSKRIALSAGRVQTPVLGWIIRNYLEYLKKRRRYCIYRAEGMNDLYISVEGECRERYALIKSMVEEERDIPILPPYTTDTLLRDASALLGMRSSIAMGIAQELFEKGLITYHRTDSTRISPAGINIAEKYLREKIGDPYKNIFSPRTWGEGGAHEAIRPTRPIDSRQLRLAIDEGEIDIKLGREHIRLYDLIFRRFISSQISGMKGNYIIFDFEIDGKEYREERIIKRYVKGIGDNLSLDFVYPGVRMQDSLNISIENFKENRVRLIPYRNTFRSEILPYTEGDLVSEMKRNGIGRPSTYATVIETIKERGYATEKGSWIIPTDLGIEVHRFLSKRYGNYVSEDRTRMLMEKMDKVERGAEDYSEVLHSLLKEIISLGRYSRRVNSSF
ncbi:MAG: reverse gyrase [Thermoplasmatales archaeon]|nr:reverse gyrase [Thermoplasmatales archaeon]